MNNNTDIQEHDIVVVAKENDMASIGDEGTVVHIHNLGEAYEVEFPSKKNLVITMYKDEIKKKL